MRKLAPLVLVAVLSACARPSDGPTAGGFYNATAPQSNERIPVVRLSEAPMGPVAVTPLAYAATDPGLSLMRSGGFADTKLRRGDVIEVTILDPGEDGLFSSTQSKTLNLGRFTVDSTGNVTLPFIGKQRVVDSSPEALQTRIVTGLKGSAVNPQAVVTVVDRPSSGFTVNGDVRSAGRFPLSARKERVLDAVALAGGASSAPGSATVTLMRGKQRATVPLQRVIDDSKQNVYLLPDDQIYVDKDSPTFTAFGAFKSVGEFEFEPGKLTLAQALGRAGGLLDDRADASNFYVLRNQPVYTQVAAANGKNAAPPVVRTKPVIYRVNLKDVSNLALMQRFQMMDGDIIYASNASLVDFAKLFNVYQKSVPTAAAPIPGSSGN
ncbi:MULTISPECIES: polysaccharide biosynthesis/export family protein [Rhizobium]|jgi:polysaccharide export outer membrane protein|uniref:polysaccharide biosynthesis/export family protein n=1 Tax=Rhizobium TaxID=379 RepID=UPI0007B51CF2|nr:MULTISPECIES: polysaccharide biosynthesis/export family protein [unclassified Rhizobium]KZS55078.1 capsule biosynthesis protein [Rhizobium anhuiense bv. trifolii]PDS36975.1 capsule biosynthesis protein [Rhizobium anhuiense]PDS56726.1 capsule biosynthesis protein [Rhizobium anhuiense]PDS64172.1 capsule biosynthesis protein [Rhizobium anhuiense]